MITIHLIDASPYIFRAFYALPRSIRDRDGQPANAIYGFASFLVKYLTDARPTHVAVAFDQNLNSSFRNQTLAAYKATRPAPPAELESQLATCLEAARALGVAAFIDPDYEADDLIATLVARLDRRDRRFVVVSVDKDLAQLVGERVQLCDPGRSVRLDAAGVHARYGVHPHQIVDWLALAGDAVDNIPGVPGIGPKTAADLLRRYGSLEAVYREVESLRRSTQRGARGLAARLETHVETAALSRQMATLSRDAPVRADLRTLRYTGIDEDRARDLFARLGFGTLAARLVPRNSTGA
jgi:5'-3' exonuclease